MIIRKANSKDILELEILFQFIRRETFKSRPENEFQIGDYAKSVEQDKVWVAEEDNTLVGFVSIYLADNFIHNLFVHPNYQNLGIGSCLLQTAEDNLSSPMTLKIALDNPKVCPFYKSHGWLEMSIHEDVPEPYILYKKD
ncbi:MAG: GNAT family N-acetyltransferase [Janthinobacterium lividum]